MALLDLINIRKSYRDGENRLNHVLRDINMSVAAGEFVAIQGVSGSGKTTLLSVLGTLLAPDSGRYLLDGTDITAATGLDRIRNERIGFVFQDHRLLPQYTVWENILLPTLAYAAESNAEEKEYARKLMELVRISALSGQYPHTLSGGEAGRVALCRALIRKPLLLLADEPTGQLDRENARNIVALLSEINRSLHTTIIMATHSAEASSAAHRVLMLQGGTI